MQSPSSPSRMVAASVISVAGNDINSGGNHCSHSMILDAGMSRAEGVVGKE